METNSDSEIPFSLILCTLIATPALEVRIALSTLHGEYQACYVDVIEWCIYKYAPFRNTHLYHKYICKYTSKLLKVKTVTDNGLFYQGRSL